MRQNQREVIRVDPDDAELGVVGVVSGHVFQDLQEFIAIWEQQQRNLSLPSGAKDNKQGKKTGKPTGKRHKPGSSSSANATICIPSMSSSYKLKKVYSKRLVYK